MTLTKMKKTNKLWKFLGISLGIGAVVCIIPSVIISCSSTNSTTSQTPTTNPISNTLNSWTTNFNNLENSDDYKTDVTNWLTSYVNDLSDNFNSFATLYNQLTKNNNSITNIATGYVASNLTMKFSIPDPINNTSENANVSTTLYWKLDSASLVANSVQENDDHQFSFSIKYDEDYELIVNNNISKSTNSGIKSVDITTNFQNVTFAPTILGNWTDILNPSYQNINVYGGWYINDGSVSFTSSIIDNTNTPYTIDFSKSTNPTSENWIDAPSIMTPASFMWNDLLDATNKDGNEIGSSIATQKDDSLWYSKFLVSSIYGFATSSHNNLTTLQSIANPNLQQLSSLKVSSLNIVYPDPNIPTSNSTSSSTTSSTQSDNATTSQQIDNLENEIQNKLDSLSPIFDPVKTWVNNEIKQAIASSNSTTLLNTLQNIWKYLQNI